MYKRPITPAPESIVTKGRFNFGTFIEPVKKINLLDASMPFLNPLFNLFKFFRLKEWQAFQMGNDKYFIMAAVYSAKVMSIVQFIVYDIKANKKYKYEKRMPWWKVRIAKGLYGTSSFHHSRNFKIKVSNDLDNGQIRLEVEIKKNGKLPPLRGTLIGFHHDEEVQPQVVSLPLGRNRGMYSHKVLMPLKGVVKFDEAVLNFGPDNSHMLLDDHKGFYPYIMKYDWVTGATHLDGHLFGFNLTDNQVKDQLTYNENCIWWKGKVHPLPPVKMERPDGIDEKWLIKDEYDMVNLEFKPVVNTRVKLNVLFLSSDYHGPYGHFSGYLRNSAGEKIEIKRIFGMGEKFYLRV